MDNRLVQTAVLGGPTSDSPLYLPPELPAAKAFRRRYRNRRFYCGRLLGGCGWELTDKLYGDRVCHFAHLPGGPVCGRIRSGEDSADHLFMHRALAGLLRKFGAKQRFTGTIRDGECTDLLVSGSGDVWAVRIQLADLPLDRFMSVDDELRKTFGRLDWMVGPEADRTARRLVDREGYVVRIRCGEDQGERTVRLGMQERGEGGIEWYRLADCRVGDNGVVRPPILGPAPARPIGADRARVLEVAVALRKARRAENVTRAIELIAQHADVIALVEQPGFERERRVLTEINAWAFTRHREINNAAGRSASMLSKKARRRLRAKLKKLKGSAGHRQSGGRD